MIQNRVDTQEDPSLWSYSYRDRIATSCFGKAESACDCFGNYLQNSRTFSRVALDMLSNTMGLVVGAILLFSTRRYQQLDI